MIHSFYPLTHGKSDSYYDEDDGTSRNATVLIITLPIEKVVFFISIVSLSIFVTHAKQGVLYLNPDTGERKRTNTLKKSGTKD